jgi:hypothetical protein
VYTLRAYCPWKVGPRFLTGVEMETEPKEHDLPESEIDEGPIVLPQGASCSTCAYSTIITVETPGRLHGSVQKVERRFCRRNPPTALLVPTGPQTAGLSAQFPPVDENMVCFEWDMAAVGLLPDAPNG